MVFYIPLDKTEDLILICFEIDGWLIFAWKEKLTKTE